MCCSGIITLHQQIKDLGAAWVRDLLRESRLGHLATSNRSRVPHVVSICFVFHEGWIYSSIDEKPKRREPEELRRIINIRANPNVCVVIDHYEENWRKLKFIIIHGKAEMIQSGKEHQQAITQLRKKYQQYRSMSLQTRPIIKISPTRIKTWRSATKSGNANKMN